MRTKREPTRRRRSIFELAALLVLAGACGRAPRRPRGVVLFLGDSLTAGFGVEPDQSFPALVEAGWRREGLPCEVRRVGMTQATTAEILGYLPLALRGDESLVFVEAGANDGLQGVPVPRIEKNLESIVSAARSRGAEVVVAAIRLPAGAPPGYERDFEELYPRLSARLGVPLMPSLIDGVYGRREYGIGDGMHPNAAGQRAIAENVEAWFKSRGQPSPDSCR